MNRLKWFVHKQIIEEAKRIPDESWFKVKCIMNKGKEAVLEIDKVYEATLNPHAPFTHFFVRTSEDYIDHFLIRRFKRIG